MHVEEGCDKLEEEHDILRCRGAWEVWSRGNSRGRGSSVAVVTIASKAPRETGSWFLAASIPTQWRRVHDIIAWIIAECRRLESKVDPPPFVRALNCFVVISKGVEAPLIYPRMGVFSSFIHERMTHVNLAMKDLSTLGRLVFPLWTLALRLLLRTWTLWAHVMGSSPCRWGLLPDEELFLKCMLGHADYGQGGWSSRLVVGGVERHAR